MAIRKPRAKKSLLYSTVIIITEWNPCDLRPAIYDLFGEVVVTQDDLFIWVTVTAPRWIYSQRAYNNYVRDWNVADKVRHSKRIGEWAVICDRATHTRPWHERLALDVILKTA